MATVHLISGLPCSGKTTYAMGLQAKTESVLFSLDRWLITLFGRYSLAEVGLVEHKRRVFACRSLIWEWASEFLQRSVNVILDDGFFQGVDRMHYAALSKTIRARTIIHFVDTSMSTIRTRLEERNVNLPQYNFYIDPENLQAFYEMFEIPSKTEGAEIVVVRNRVQNGNTRKTCG